MSDNELTQQPEAKMDTKMQLDVVSLPTISPTAAAPRPASSLVRMVALAISRTLIYCSVIAAFSVALFFITSLANVFVGVMFVGACEAVFQRSLGDLVGLIRLSTYWPYLKTSWYGGVVVSVVVSPFLGVGYSVYKSYTMDSPIQSIDAERRRARQERAYSAFAGTPITPKLSLTLIVVPAMLNTTTVSAAILANQQWWNDEIIAGVGENLMRSTIIVLVGGMINSANWLYKHIEEAKVVKVERTGEDKLPLVREERV